MKRHFYISENLDDLEAIEHELEDSGVETPQIHVLSQNDAGVKNHHLHEIEAVLKKDVVHSMEIGAVAGLVGAALVLFVAYALAWTESAAGWTPFIFLAIVVLGFCTWEGARLATCRRSRAIARAVRPEPAGSPAGSPALHFRV